MKNIFILISLMSLLLFVACGKTEEVGQVEEAVVEVTETTEDTVEKENISESNPAEIQGTIVNGDYEFNNFLLSLPGEWLEINKIEEEGFSAYTLTSEKGIMIQTSVTEVPDKVIDENSISEELSNDGYLEIEQETQVELENGSNFYGAYINDKATSVQFCYYISKIDSEVVAVIFSKRGDFSEEDLVWVHDILATFKVTE